MIKKIGFTKLVLGALLACMCPFAHAKSIYKYKAGDLDFYALIGGEGQVNAAIAHNSKDPKEDVAGRYKDTPGWNDTGYNSFLLKTDEGLVLFDTGLPKAAGGNIIDRIEEAGFKIEDIKTICLTHMHGDHIGGLLDDAGNVVFPNAAVYVAKEEADYWADTKNAKDEKSKTGFLNAQKVLKAYAKNLNKFKQNSEISSLITSVPMFGHTPGHTGFIIEDEKNKIVVWGDLIHAKVQFKNPSVYLDYDVDPVAAEKTRKLWLENAASGKFSVAGMHMAPPPYGKVSYARRRSLSGKGIKGSYRFLAAK